MPCSPRTARFASVVAVLGLSLMVVSCNRAALRIPGAALPFPQISTGYRAAMTYPYSVAVATPTDLRAVHYGERVAGTRWTGCQTDPFWGTDAMVLIRDRLAGELAASGLLARVHTGEPQEGDLVLSSEVHAFCSQAVGIFFIRVAGISAVRLTVARKGRRLFDEEIERVVTDADPQYTGSQVTFIEQAMRVTMGDSLRELIREMLVRLDRSAQRWGD